MKLKKNNNENENRKLKQERVALIQYNRIL